VKSLHAKIGDRGGQAAGPVTSAMRRKRPTTVSGRHVVELDWLVRGPECRR
jgi:hypothetical protein